MIPLARRAICRPGRPRCWCVADDTARADFVAADLLAQAEHDAQAQAILVTPSRQLAEATAAAIQAQLGSLSRRAILDKSLASSRCIVVVGSRNGDTRVE